MPRLHNTVKNVYVEKMQTLRKNMSSLLYGSILVMAALFQIKLHAQPSFTIKGSLDTPVQGITTFSLWDNKIYFHSNLPATSYYSSMKLPVSDYTITLDPVNRFTLPKELHSPKLGGFLKELDDDRLLMWDNFGLNLVVIRKNSPEVIESKSIALDLVKPPKDSKGEATKTEAALLRAKFQKDLSKVFGPKIVSVRQIKTKDKSNKADTYIVGSRIPSFPVLLLNCKKEDPTECIAERACYIDESSKALHGEIFGVDLNLESNRLIIGDSKLKKLHVYRWTSCFDNKYLYSLDLPKQLLKPTALQVDDSNRLWISSGVLDGFTNSSLFYWNKNEWQR